MIAPTIADTEERPRADPAVRNLEIDPTHQFWKVPADHSLCCGHILRACRIREIRCDACESPGEGDMRKRALCLARRTSVAFADSLAITSSM